MSRAMYAVIRTGGKQYKVEAGEQLEVERLGLDDGSELELAPLLVVDGDTVQATPSQLEGAVVKARVVGETRGPKIDGFIYKPKSNNRRRYGHRQDLSVIEIVGITPAGK
jgi:large subunit ribosomal protein L21